MAVFYEVLFQHPLASFMCGPLNTNIVSAVMTHNLNFRSSVL